MTTRAAKLVVLATPIGNLSDLSNRVIYTLRDLKYFFVEDTRELTKLMSAYDISHIGKEIFSYARHNMKGANERALELLKAGESVGMLCDRGTPCISDPGFLLVRAARSLGFAVIPIPGCSSIIAALSVSGLPSDKFLFLGFLPKEPGKMQAVLDEMVRAPYTIGFFESPQRIRRTVTQLKELFPERMLFVAREMTKLFEQYILITLRDLPLENLVEKGEYTLILQGVEKGLSPESLDWKKEVLLRVSSDKAWSKEMGLRHGISPKLVYDTVLYERRKK